MNREALGYISREDLEELCGNFIEAIKDVKDLIKYSSGVCGLHEDGDMITWSELLEGGVHEEWLQSLSKVGVNNAII